MAAPSQDAQGKPAQPAAAAEAAPEVLPNLDLLVAGADAGKVAVPFEVNEEIPEGETREEVAPPEGEEAVPGEGEETAAPGEEPAPGEEAAAPEGEGEETKPLPEETAPKPAVIPQEVQQAAAHGTEFSRRFNSNEKFRLATLEAYEEEGQLPVQWQPELDRLRGKIVSAPVVPAAPKMTLADAKTQAKKLAAEGREDEAIELLTAQLMETHVGPQLAQIRRELASEKTQRTSQAQGQAASQRQAQQRAELADVAQLHPKLIQYNAATDQAKILDKKFEAQLVEMKDEFAPNTPLKTVFKRVLQAMGRWQEKPAPGRRPAPAGRPPVGSTPRAVSSAAPKPQQGEVSVQYGIVE